uniref:3-hydroxy-3-methylglutaryl coenzyme A n=1 Tax=Rhizophora mucronata TaxID=61149 RepID=A0A2P2PRX9_RHIMU
MKEARNAMRAAISDRDRMWREVEVRIFSRQRPSRK